MSVDLVPLYILVRGFLGAEEQMKQRGAGGKHASGP